MSVFYVLPPRPVFGDRIAAFLQGFLPGLDFDAASRTGLADAVAEFTGGETDAYLIFRDELPSGERLAQALADGFGAEEDDEVVEIRAAEAVVVRWRLGDRLIAPARAA